MKVVALKGFYATVGNVKKGDLIDVHEKFAKSWVAAGLARVAEKGDTQPVVEPHHPLNDVELEPETAEETGDQPDGDPDKEGETGNDGEGGDEPTEPTENTNPNQTKASK